MSQEPEHIETLKVALGRELASRRLAAGKTQKQLARPAGYSRPMVSNAEAGKQLLNEKFWKNADEMLEANGTLLARYEEVAAAAREHREAQIAALRERARQQAAARSAAAASVPLPASQHIDLATAQLAQKIIGTLATSAGIQVPDELVTLLSAQLASLAVITGKTDVLSRIADGLAVLQGLIRLVCDSPSVASSEVQTEGDIDMERRGFIGLVVKAAMVGLSGAELARIRVVPQATPVPGRIGHPVVSNLETTVQFFRAQDDQFGGGAVKSAVVGHLEWATGMLDSPAADDVRQRLRRALSDLHSLAGWASFDLGAHDQANRHFANALVLAKDAEEHALAAKVLFQMGRVYLHRGEPENALKIFQLGQISAQDANSPRAVALLCLNEAWAYAEMGNAVQTKSQLARASDELARDIVQDVPSWLEFMGSAEIEGISGMAYTALSAQDRSFAELGIQHASRSFEMRAESDARSRTSDLIAAAANNLRAGNITEGVRTASDALVRLDEVRSSRLMDRLKWVQQAANLHPRIGEARDLAERITQLRSA